MTIHAHAAMAPRQTLNPFQYEPAGLGPWDVEVAITHCGICHSDIHLIDNDWGISSYPLVPGHEIIGTVEDAGAEVKHLKKGQRVGVGWQRGSCLVCEQCLKGNENLCPENRATCVGNHGGFAERIRVDSRFAFPIPDALASENAAPLLCGGATVYSPLKNYGVVPSMRIGVIGIGGLGHLALQFANAFGCEVTAFSSTPDKEKEAGLFGAHRFIASANLAAPKKPPARSTSFYRPCSRTSTGTRTSNFCGRTGNCVSSACPRRRSRFTSAPCSAARNPYAPASSEADIPFARCSTLPRATTSKPKQKS